MKNPTPITWTFSTLGCPTYDLGAAVNLAKQNQLAHLELRALEDRVDLPALFTETVGTPEALKLLTEEAGVQIISLDTSLKLSGNTPEDRAAFLEFLPWAEALGTPYLRVFDGGKMVDQLSPEELDGVVETISWWRKEQSRSNWSADIMVETHDCMTRTPAIQQVQSVLERPVPILWDTHHTWKKAGENPADTWAAIKSWVPHVHVKDSISEPSARHPFTYVQLGEGEFDLSGTLNTLRSDGYAGVVSIEWERKWHPYMPPLETALAKARELGWW